MSPIRRGLFCVPALLLLAAGTARAQRFPDPELRSRFGAELAGGYGFTAGAIGDSIGGGPMVEATGFYQLEGVPVRVGAGASYAWFAQDDLPGSQKKLGVFATGTLLIRDVESTMTPYVQGRIGWTRFSDDAGYVNSEVPEADLAGTRSRSGLELGALVGVDIPFRETVHFDVSGAFSWQTLGDYTVQGTTIPGTDAGGSIFALRAGVVLLTR